MKIVVNGKMIETSNIYSISEIYKDRLEDGNTSGYGFVFDIVSLNNMTERVFILFNGNDPLHTKLEKLRQEIIKIWSNSQSDIPVFDVKNM
jgi:hypothetical protein